MKVSIATICRNNADGLKRTIDSVRKQTFRDFEFIITDGASTDKTIDIIKANEDIIDNWVSEPDSGIYNAMNKTLARCQGEYVIFMNSGDCFYDGEVLQKVFSVAKSSDVIYGDVQFEKILRANKKIFTLQDFFCKSPFCHQGVFTRLEKAISVGFKEEYTRVADWAMFLTLFMSGCSFEYVPCIVAQCESNGISADAGANNKERLFHLEKTYSNRITDDYRELQHIKDGVLFKFYVRLEQSKKLKYYILSLLNFFHVKSS